MNLLPPRHEGTTAEIAPFYVVGGTMPGTALSYVERQADRDLYTWLRAGEFCYVLTSRQMGKSSLMVRTAAHLRQQAGMAVASIDLTSVGQNLTLEQWYLGMLRRIGRQLDLEDAIDDHWKKERSLGPLQRWLSTLSEVVLEDCPENLVIFVDEIDVVRSLPFKTDEFFAGIRDCYNRRSSEPAFRRLTFCLLGVATPSHLIRDPHLTPFNIGRRVELRDFTPAEAAPLASGLLQPGLIGPVDRVSGQLLERVLYWTDGHPYLTQRLCQAVAAERSVRTTGDVDRICGEIFLGRGAEEKDNNLLFVRESILRGVQTEAELSSLLRLYAGIRAGKRIEDDAADRLITALRLSGITKVESGALRVRNRIYQHVFDRAWVTASLPDAELRRHRAAFLAGVRRTLLLSALVITTVLVLAWTALLQAQRATQREKEQRRLLFWADMKIAEQALEQQNIGLATQTLTAHRDDAFHNFVWGYLWKQCHGESLQIPVRSPSSVAFSPDDRYLAVGTAEGDVHVLDARTGAEEQVFATEFRIASAIAFSRDGKYVAASGSERKTRNGPIKAQINVWSLATGRKRALSVPYSIFSLQFSPDGRSLQTNPLLQNNHFWNIETGRAEMPRSENSFRSVRAALSTGKDVPVISAISPNGRVAAVSTFRSAVHLFDTKTGHTIRVVGSPKRPIRNLSFSPDSRLLAGGNDAAHIWNVQTGKELHAFSGRIGEVRSLAYSSDGKRLAVVGGDGTAKVWQLDTAATDGQGALSGSRDITLKGFRPEVRRAQFAFSLDGGTVASHFQKGSEIAVWNSNRGTQLTGFTFRDKSIIRSAFRANGHDLAVSTQNASMQVFDTRSGTEITGSPESAINGFYPLAYSPDGRWLATQRLEKIVVQNLQDPRLSFSLYGHKPNVVSGAFSQDGKLLATGSWDKTARVWDVAQQKLLLTLGGHFNLVRAVAFAPDRTTLATAGTDGIIRLWDITVGREVCIIDAGVSGLAALTFTPDGSELKAAFTDGKIRSWFAAPAKDIERWIAEDQKKREYGNSGLR